MVENPFIGWISYCQSNQGDESAEARDERLLSYVSRWHCNAIDLLRRRDEVDAAIIVWECLLSVRTLERFRKATSFPIQKQTVRGWIKNNELPDYRGEFQSDFDFIDSQLRDTLEILDCQPPSLMQNQHTQSQHLPSFAPIFCTRTDTTSINRKCVVLVPYLNEIEIGCETALRGLEDHGFEVRRVKGIGAVDLARNCLVTEALADGFEEILWIDDDMSFDLSTVEALRRHNVPIVGAVVAKKNAREFATVFHPWTSRVILGKDGGLLEVDLVGTGLLLTKRCVYESIQERFKLAKCVTSLGTACIPFFQPEVVPTEDGNWYMSEDYAFINKARQCGYRILVDTAIRVGHIGRHEYTWEDVGLERRRYATFSVDI